MTFDIAMIGALLAATLRLAVPVIVAALGELVIERSGVLNLGIEGTMLSGAYGGYIVALSTGSPWLGILAGLAVGAAVGILLAVLMVVLRTDQIITGLAFAILASAVTTYLFELSYTVGAAPSRIAGIDLGEITAVAVVSLLTVWIVLQRTSHGMSLTAIGEDPASADALGLRVNRTRFVAVVLGNAVIGMAGALLVCGPLGLFVQNVTGGRGWIALALVVFARWKPVPVLFGGLLFGFCDALRLRLQTAAPDDFPYEIFIALPYVVTILALVIGGRSGLAPSALGIPYHRGSPARR